MSNDKSDAAFEEMLKHEIKFCEQIEAVKNKHDVYIYTSTNGHSSFNLPCILQEYKEWLIENKIVKEI